MVGHRLLRLHRKTHVLVDLFSNVLDLPLTDVGLPELIDPLLSRLLDTPPIILLHLDRIERIQRCLDVVEPLEHQLL